MSELFSAICRKRLKTPRVWPIACNSRWKISATNFPNFPVPPGETMDSVLREQAFAGARSRYGSTIPDKVRAATRERTRAHRKARVRRLFSDRLGHREILPREQHHGAGPRQRGEQRGLFLPRHHRGRSAQISNCSSNVFSAKAAKVWPDIDIDLPSGDRRERVIQEIYQRYGKHGAAMTANVITYRGRSAAREIGKALNISDRCADSFFQSFRQRRFSAHARSRPRKWNKSGLPREHPRAAAFRVALPSDLRLAAASRPAFRRHDHLPGQTRFHRSARKRLDARPRRRAMGQGRLRRPRHHQSRFSRPRHDVRAAGCRRT